MSDTTAIEEARKRLKELNVQRNSLELESEAIVSELTTSENPNIPPMGVDTPLVDKEGYPRNDIDVYRARTLRSRLAEIRNDHKALMGQIESSLSQLSGLQKTSGELKDEAEEIKLRAAEKPKPKFDPKTGKWVVKNWDGSIAGTGEDSKQEPRSFDELSADLPNTLGTAATTAPTAASSDDIIHHQAAVSTTPLARVNTVEPNSPAAEAGLLVEDRILAFGPIHDTMDGIGELVQQAAAAHQNIGLRVHRGSGVSSSIILLVLAPRAWSGRGFLGCHIVPVS